jgi:hypothetical protein
MSDSEYFWLNVTNAVLGTVVLLPLLAVLVAVLFELGSSMGRRMVFHFRPHLNHHHPGHWSPRR